jgi:hypothetical protein
MTLQQNPQLKLAYDFVQHTNKNVFLTGKAGTGKTTFLHSLKELTPKRMVVVAPTGVAAINAGGVTIHSFFQLPFGPHIPEHSLVKNDPFNSEPGQQYNNSRKFNRDKINLIKSLDLLVIDEISMVRADMLDAIDEVLRRYKNPSKPFGGIQLLLIGDLHQLSPIVKEDEWDILRKYYDTIYFFSSNALQKSQYISIELKEIFRQSDAHFIDLLNQIRINDIDEYSLTELNERYIPGFKPNDDEGYIILTTHNNKAHEVNQFKLNKIQKPEVVFEAEISGEFPPDIYPTEYDLLLKEGSQVMFVKNDTAKERLFYNGKIGKITMIDGNTIYVRCTDEHFDIPVSRMTWNNMRYNLNEISKEIEENVIGTFTQYPLKLAWAITIHKSQGLTFEKAIIDARASFAYGQVYVALSRCKSLEGMVLSSPLMYSSIRNDQTIADFTSDIDRNEPDKGQLDESKIQYQRSLIFELFDFEEIKKRFYWCFKNANEFSNSLDATVLTDLNKIEIDAKNEIYEVAEKFKIQLTRLTKDTLLEENTELQDRVKKGSTFFKDKIEPILYNTIRNFNIETDNKAVKKTVNEALSKLLREVYIKMECMKYGMEGFTTLGYLQAKANADIDFKGSPKVPLSNKVIIPKNIKHSALYADLRNWRNALAEENDVPDYMIIPYKVLVDLATYLPLTIYELGRIKGMGNAKVNQFGEDIIAIITHYCELNKIDKTPIEIPENKKKVKKQKGETRILSFELYKEGNSIEQIAKIRGVVNSTIEGHLAYYVGTGDLDINDFVSKDKIDRITEFYNRNQLYSFSEAKNLLGANISYADIRFVLMYMEFCNKAINI